MPDNTYNNILIDFESWNKYTYPIIDQDQLLKNFYYSLEEIINFPEIKNKTASQDEYCTIYNKVMLNPIFDSHPIKFSWKEKDDEFISDIESAISLANNIFHTIETKNAYLISLAVAFKKSAPKTIKTNILDNASKLIYEEIFKIENENNYKNNSQKNIEDEYTYTADGQALAFQIQYHRWMIINKSILPETSYMRNRFINIVIRKNFPKHTPDPESKDITSYSESHAKLKEEISNHLKFDVLNIPSDDLDKWINSFVNNVMLVYYGFYKWDKLRGDFYEVFDLENSKFGKKIPDNFEENNKEFSKFINI